MSEGARSRDTPKDGDDNQNYQGWRRTQEDEESPSSPLSETKRTSSYRGVSYHARSKKWKAVITANRKQEFLGYYETEKEAAKAFDKAARRLRGEAAILNLPDEYDENETERTTRKASSKYRGVSYCKSNRKWKAMFTSQGKQSYLGYYNTEVEAAEAYDKAALATLGERAKLNFEAPDDAKDMVCKLTDELDELLALSELQPDMLEEEESDGSLPGDFAMLKLEDIPPDTIVGLDWPTTYEVDNAPEEEELVYENEVETFADDHSVFEDQGLLSTDDLVELFMDVFL